MHLKWACFIIYEFYLNKVDLQRKKPHTNRPQKAEQYENYAFILERLRHC